MNKIDLEDVKFSLDNIASTLGPVMEDMEQEHLHSKDLVQNFYARMESVYRNIAGTWRSAAVSTFAR